MKEINIRIKTASTTFPSILQPAHGYLTKGSAGISINGILVREVKR
ncbi:hypothetical protein RUMHYD_03545 [Blautia hydrogenotrophica DSM 10507]|uniref:Uncharacterized protein n=1 Tax=Blautia hydrogenotrophica (strain DSM 10507 / JCM 14656 / S5a33) TaxID=476272 RepID=C0CRN1_BLAHS|nr:hypothetical protein RUMHYD_03545 [Blautia hydrogenotrophica DSM 10507]